MGNSEGDTKRAFLPVATLKHIRAVQMPKPPVEEVEQTEPIVEKEITGSADIEPVVVEDEATELVDMDQSAIDPEYVVDAGQPEPSVEEETTELVDIDQATKGGETEPVDADHSAQPETVEEDLVYVQQGSTITVYSRHKETFSSPGQMPHREKCTSACTSGAMVPTYKPRECTTPTGLKFRLELGKRMHLPTLGQSNIVIAILYLESTDSNGVTSSLEVQKMLYFGDELPLEALGECTLVVMRGHALEGDFEFVRPCHHGHTFCLKEDKSPKIQYVYVRPRYGEYAILDFDSLSIRRSAYIPVGKYEREMIIRQAQVRPPPSFASWFGMSGEPHLSTFARPVFQTRDILPRPGVCLSDVFVAPYDLLWYHEEEEGEPGTKKPTTSLRTNWFKAFFSVLGLKLRIKRSNPVKCYDLGEELFDNPAISALLEYRWNTFASAYWRFRFICQCLYHLLVLTLTLLQVYYPTPLDLTRAYIPIVVFSAIFLWVEFQQFLRIKAQYFKSPYNTVDLIVYTLPLAGGIVGIVQEVNEAETRALRLFELRVIKSVCKTVTVIIKVVGEIKVFFVIFAASIIAFTHTFIHLLWARKGADIDGEINHHASADYPKNPFMAFSATYFFMGGRLDPVSDLFSQKDTWFHVMMIVYFFFTIILMLNVHIALVIVAFNTGDESWRVIWHENRLRYIESAENVTMNIPGFRRRHSWFPNEVYYTATQKEVDEYETKYGKPVTSQLAREGNSKAEPYEVIRKFVAMQVPLRPLEADGDAAVVAAEVTVDADIAVEAEEGLVAVGGDVVVTAAIHVPAPVSGAVHHAGSEQDGALDLIQQRRDALQALASQQQVQAQRQQEEARQREEALQKQLQDIMSLLHQSSSSTKEA
ncbi:hypothetical protein BGZ82_006742 [Podila clonocystis]|nr:hypothetical protein BGZ82_006742 [Podila clonocystis]